jgi:hypothetical protein
MATFGFAAGVYEKLGLGLYSIDVRRGFADARYGTGADKLVFEVIYCLLTTLGSIPSDEEFGTLLPAMVGRVSVNDVTELQNFVQVEFNRAQAVLMARQRDQQLPDDQRLQRLIADSIEIDKTQSMLTVTAVVTNAAGQSVGMSIPFSTEIA